MMKKNPKSGKTQEGQFRGKQQMLKFDEWIGWFAGIMDGEGTISLSRSNRKTWKHPYLKPTFQMVNTNLTIIEKSCEIIRSFGIKPTIVLSNKNVPNHRYGFRVAVHAARDLNKILPVIIPYLVSKKEQAELVLGFCRRRGNRLHPRRYEFAELDQAAYERCLQLNRRGVATVESGGGSPEQSGEGALRANEKSLEAAEMTVRQLRLVNK